MIKKIIVAAISLAAISFSTTSMADGFSLFGTANKPVSNVNTSTPYTGTIVEGKDYVRVDNTNEQLNPQANSENLVEFFGYPCSHCFDMQPMLDNFKKTHPKVDIIPVPAMFGGMWDQGGQLYYALKEIGLSPENHTQIFNLMHVQHKYILDNKALRDTELAKLGYKPEQVEQMMNSFTVQSKMKNASMLMRQYKVTGTPTFIINNKYMTSPALTQSYEKTIAVINYLENKKD